MAEASQNFHCFLCNVAGLPVKNGIAIFDEDAVLESGLRLSEAVSQIVGRPIDPLAVHSTNICRKCHKTCQEYDEINKRLTSLKSKMADQFRQTLPKYNLSYDTYNRELPNMEVDLTGLKVEPTQVKKEGSTPMKTLILPKSKLTPIPSNLVMMNRNKVIQGNINKVMSLKDCGFISPKKVSWPGTSLIKPQPTITSPLKENSGFNALTKTNTSILNPSTSSSGSITNVSILVDIPPENNDQGNVAESKFKKEIPEIASARTNFVDPEGPSTYYLKTDTDFNKIFVHSVGEVQTTLGKKVQSRNDPVNFQSRATGIKEEIFPHKTASDVSEQSIKESFPKDKFVISEVEIMEEGQDVNSEDDDEDETILMDQDVSIIRVMRGEHGELVFPKDDQMSLVVPQGAGSDSDTHSRYKIECQDSNDDTQIELQMSEDEETANAIIAAANKKGATYIKMGSGEMYRVKAIKSTVQEQDGSRETEEAAEPAEPAVSAQIVERVGSVYTCLICKNASKESADSESVDDASSEPTRTAGEGAVFTMPRDIMMHLKSCHHLRVYLCPVCGDVFRRRSEHNAHLMQHGEKKVSSQADRMKQYSCSVCSKKYSSRNLLDEHMNQHTGVRPYTCTTCDKAFASKYTHQAHVKTHTNRPRPFSCTQCNKSFFTLPNLSQHQKTHSGIKEFFCNVCGKGFATQHNLDVHGVVHTGDKPYVCGLCEKPFARRAEIRDHMRTHTGERPFECDMCDAKFSQRSNLLSHRRVTHLGDKRHACQHCEKRFKRRRLLDYHTKACHTGERPYKCAMCGATFVYPEHYKKHTRAHSGEKPYVCEVCNRTFNSRDNRNAHRYTHSDKKPYECVVCGAGFMRKPLLYAHMNSQGHLSDIIVVNQARLTNKVNTTAETSKSDVIVLDEDKLQTPRSLGDSNISEMFGDMANLAKVQMETETSAKSNEDEATVNLVQTGVSGEHSLLTLTGGMTGDGGGTEQDLLCSSDVEELLAQGTEVLTTDEDGNILRLVQIQLPDGKTGWVALEP